MLVHTIYNITTILTVLSLPDLVQHEVTIPYSGKIWRGL